MRLLLTFLIATSALAQNPESMTSWKWVQDVQTEPYPLAELWLDQQVLFEAREDLADLRLYDASGREIPYALRTLYEVNTSDEFEARLFNRSSLGPLSLASIDLGENPETHNEVRVETTGKNFRRQVRVDGSDDGQTWSVLASNALVFRFASGGRSVEEDRVRYTDSRYRYLRVAVGADHGENAPTIETVVVRRTIEAEGEHQEFPAVSQAREATRDQGRPASRYTLEFGGRIPLNAIQMFVNEAEFTRPFRLEKPRTGSRYPELVASGTLRPSEDDGPVVIRFDETFAHTLTLTIVDDRNPPLGAYSISAQSPVRQLLFDASAIQAPLRLYFGNQNAGSPNYDFSGTIPRIGELKSQAFRVFADPPQVHADYIPPAVPLTERSSWLVYLVLTAACLALFVILRNLVREVEQTAEPVEEVVS